MSCDLQVCFPAGWRPEGTSDMTQWFPECTRPVSCAPHGFHNHSWLPEKVWNPTPSAGIAHKTKLLPRIWCLSFRWFRTHEDLDPFRRLKTAAGWGSALWFWWFWWFCWVGAHRTDSSQVHLWLFQQVLTEPETSGGALLASISESFHYFTFVELNKPLLTLFKTTKLQLMDESKPKTEA